jgi:hypothetical protein
VTRRTAAPGRRVDDVGALSLLARADKPTMMPRPDTLAALLRGLFSRRRTMNLRVLALVAVSALFCFDCSVALGPSNGDVPYVSNGDPCDANYECDSDVCDSGECAPPPDGEIEIGADCTTGEDCVGDADCSGGVCVATGSDDCGVDGDQCETDDDCCAGGTCSGGTCGGDTGAGGDGAGGDSGQGGSGQGGSGQGGDTGNGGSGGDSNCKAAGDACSDNSECCSMDCDTSQNQCN